MKFQVAVFPANADVMETVTVSAETAKEAIFAAVMNNEGEISGFSFRTLPSGSKFTGATCHVTGTNYHVLEIADGRQLELF